MPVRHSIYVTKKREIPRSRSLGEAIEEPTLISSRQKAVHQSSEALAVWVGVPFFAYLALNSRLPGWARLLSAAFGVGTLVVDGGLLATWAAKAEGKEGPYSSYCQNLFCRQPPG